MLSLDPQHATVINLFFQGLQIYQRDILMLRASVYETALLMYTALGKESGDVAFLSQIVYPSSPFASGLWKLIGQLIRLLSSGTNYTIRDRKKICTCL